MANDDEGDSNVVSLRGDRSEKRVYATTMVSNSRRYAVDQCQHRGPYILDRKLACVECGDCGAMLNPLFVLEILANREAYWNMRQRDLGKYLDEINAEIKERTRTKCTHCGNMTPIRFKREMPRTWMPDPY